MPKKTRPLSTLSRQELEAKVLSLESKLKICEDRNHLRMNQAEVVILELDDQGRIQFLNAKGREILECEKEDIQNLDWFRSFLPTNIRGQIRSAHFHAMDGNVGKHRIMENPVITRSGKERLILWQNQILRDENQDITGTISTGMDVTDYLQYAFYQEQEKSLLNQFSENLGCAIYVRDLKTGQFVYGCKSTKEIYGYDSDFFDAEVEKVLSILVPEDRPKWLEAMRKQREEKIWFNLEYRIVRPDGQIRWVWTRSFPIRNSSGKVIRVVGITDDVTEKRRILEQLRDSRKDLERKVKERTAQLKDLAGRFLAAQEEELKHISRELHDDVSQRLAVLAIEAGTLFNRCENAPVEDKKDLLKIRKGLVQLANDVHGLSRRLHPSILEDLGLQDAVASECESFQARTGIRVNLEQKNISLNLPKEVCLCVYRVVQEALNNVQKHSKAENVEIHIQGSPSELLFYLADDGVGFGNQGSGDEKPGLGLESIRERVDHLAGKLLLASAVGKGSSMDIRIPLGENP